MLSFYNIAFMLFLIIYGIFLLIKTSGYKYIGMTLVFLAFTDLFYSISSLLMFSWIRPTQIIVSIILFICLIYFFTIELKIWKDSTANAKETFDYIIVHGAKVYGTTPSPSLSDRLEATLHYMETCITTKAILTGSKWPYAEISEAQCMYNWLTERGIDENRLILEEQATNTLENLRLSMEFIHTSNSNSPIKLGLLTSDYHMHRALYIARAEGLAVSGISASTRRFFVKINYFIREAFAMTELYLFGVEGL